MNRLYLPLWGQAAIILGAVFIWFPLMDTYLLGCTNFWHSGRQLIWSARSWGLFSNTLIIGLSTTLGSLVLALPVGYFLGHSSFNHNRLWIYAGLAPILIPPHINVLAWTDLLGAKGFLNTLLLNQMHLKEPLINILSLGGVVFVLTLSYFSYLTLFVLSAFLSLDPSLEEAGSLSLSRRQVFWRITLPFIRPYLLAGMIIVFVFATGNYGVPALLGVHTYPVEIFAEFSAFLNTDKAIVISFPLLCLVSIFMVWHWHLMRRLDFAILSPQSLFRRPRQSGHACLATGVLGTVIILAVVLPVFWILRASASSQSYVTAFKTAWQPILTTLVLAGVTATVAVLACYPAAYYIVRTGSWASASLDFCSFLPLAIPGMIVGVGLIKVWNHPATDFLYGSAAILVLGYLAQFSSFALRCLVPSLRQINCQLEDSFLIQQPGWFQRQWQIVVPMARNELAIAWILIFVLCLGELGSTLLVIPPGMETLSLRIYNLMHYGAYDIVAALAAILLGLSLVPLVVCFYQRAK